MSRSLGWKPVKNNEPKLFSFCPSFMDVLKNCFGDYPFKLSTSETGILDILDGVRACGWDSEVDELLDILNRMDSIMIDEYY